METIKKIEKFFEKIFKKNEKWEFWNTVPKTRKGGPFGLFEPSVCCKISKNLKGGPFGDKKIFDKKSRTVPKKIQRGDPVVPSVFASYVKNWVHERGDPLH